MTNTQPITKAVIAAAGFGTRFLPQTKAMPKEMLPLVDKPIIQYIVEELVEAGIQDIVIVTGYHKRTIEDHFDAINGNLEQSLRQGGKQELLDATSAISDLANFVYVRQKGFQGNATPLLNAEHLLGNEPCLYVYADDVFQATPSRFRQMMAVYSEYGGIIHSCIEITSDDEYERYGVVGGEHIRDGLIKMNAIVEKPGRESAPSTLASIGSYIITPELFPYLHKQLENHDGQDELKVQIAMQDYISNGGNMYGIKIENGKYYDTGNKLEYLKTVVDFALMHPELKDEFAGYLSELINKRQS